MADDDGKNGSKGVRQDRLKLALRENLKRRKAQARERNRGSDAPSPGHEISHDTSLDGEVGEADDTL